MANEEDTSTILEKAEKAFASERYARACILYEKIPLHERPDKACFKLGQAYLERKRYDQALKSLQQALDKGYDSAGVHHAMGQVKVGMGNDVDALKEFEASINISPNQEASLLDAGRAHERLKTYDRAMDFYQRGAALQHATIEPQLCLARIFDARGQHTEVVDALKLAITREPENGAPYDILIDVLPKLPERDRAATLDAITETVTHSKNNEALLTWIETLTEGDELTKWGVKLFIEKAKELWDRYQIDESRLVNEWRLAEIVRRIGYRDDLGPQVWTVLDHLSSPVLHAVWGHACAAAGRIDEALEQFRLALQRDSKGEHIREIANEFYQGSSSSGSSDILARMEEIVESIGEPRVLVNWAMILYDVQKYEQAVAVLDRVSGQIDSPSLSGQLHSIWKDVLVAQGKHSEAIPHILETLRLNPSNKWKWDGLVIELPEAERPEQWNKEISELLDATSDPSILVNGARVLTSTGSPVSAVAYLERGLQRDPSQSDAYEHLGELLPKLDNQQAIIDRIGTIVKQANNAIACREWGKVLDKLGRGNEAVSFLDTACKLDPDDHEAPLFLSGLHRKGERFEQGFDLHVLAAELGPEEGDVYTSWADCLVEQEKKRGVTARLADALGKADIPTASEVNWEDIRKTCDTQLKEIERLVSNIERWCDDTWVYVECGVKIHNNLAAYARKTAERLYRGGSALDPKHFWSLFNFGTTKENQMQYRKAQEEFTKAHDLASNPNEHFMAQVEFARSLAATQKLTEADQAYKEVLETGTGLTGEDDLKKRVEAYNDWALLLSTMKDFDHALEASRTALSLAPRDYWAHFRLASTYNEMGEYDRSIAEYKTAIEIVPTNPYAYHNIADCLEGQGLYGPARNQWTKTQSLYQVGLDSAIRERDAYFCFYYGSVKFLFKDFDRAESLFRAAEILDPGNAEVQRALLDLYLEQTKAAKASTSSTDTKAAAKAKSSIAFHWRAQNAYQKGKRLLEERLSDDRDPQTLLELGALELLKGEYEAAATALKEAVGKNPLSARPHQKLGETYLAQGLSKEAVTSLAKALSFQPDDLALRTVLGRAYLRAGNHDEAEREFIRVTDAAKFHVDAWVGLGEVYLEMAESKAAKDTARMDEWYDRAIEALVRGIDIAKATSADRPITITAEMDTAHYLLGYARIQLYESSRLLRDIGMVSQARADFQKCLKLNPNYTKARRALQRIKEQKGRGRTIAERIGPYLVIGLSFLMIGISLFGLLKGFVTKEAGLALTPSSIDALKDSGLKHDQVDQLKRQMTDARFTSEEKLMGRAREILGAGVSDKVMVIARKGITMLPAERQCFKVGEFTMLFFGGLLFLIASVYLPQLTSLKLPGLQLDKSASERVEPIRSLGISK